MIYFKRFVIYFILLSILLLWPFNFFQRNRVSWISGANGIEFEGNGIVASEKPIPDLCQKMKMGTGLTLSVWLSSANTRQRGPARIVSYSLNNYRRNFTLGQQGSSLVMRLRTTETSLNGANPSVVIGNVFKSLDPIHIVVTYDYTYQAVYINGKQWIQETIPGGKFKNWSAGYNLTFGNETSADRPWTGKLFQVELFDRPLLKEEVLSKFKKGYLMQGAVSPGNGSLLSYNFGEGAGRTIHNSGSLGIPANLTKSNFLRRLASNYLRWPNTSLKIILNAKDTILNIIGFIPFGFFLNGIIRNRFGLSWRCSGLVLCLGMAFSFSFESLQYFSITRDSSLVDLVANTFGTLIGILLDCSYIRHVLRFWAEKTPIQAGSPK